MRKWDIKFSGARKEDPDLFIKRIQSGRSMIFIRDQDLLNLLPFFLTGIAARWYEVHRDRWFTFEEFTRDCRNRFSDPDFQFELMQDIHRRTQGEQESVADFLTCMLSMFDRLSPRLSEYEEINFAHRNLLPSLHLVIPRNSIRNFSQFEQLAVAAEKSFRVAKSYQPPPKPEGSLLPDLAYRGPTTRLVQRRRENINQLDETNSSEEDELDSLLMIHNSTNKGTNHSADKQINPRKTIDKPSYPEKNTKNPKIQSSSPQTHKANPKNEKIEQESIDKSPNLTCWNCDENGHRHNDCTEAKNVFCYGCGLKNVTKPKCPNCPGKEKQSR